MLRLELVGFVTTIYQALDFISLFTPSFVKSGTACQAAAHRWIRLGVLGGCSGAGPMASLQFAKESILLKAIQDVADNDKRTQELELTGSTVWKSKSVMLTASLADALLNNTKLTALNLSECNVGDGALCKLADAIQHNATLYDLNLARNKLGRPGLVHLKYAP